LPHIYTKNLTLPDVIDDIKIDFIGEEVFSVICDGEEALFLIKNRGNEYLIKSEKHTRLSKTSKIQYILSKISNVLDTTTKNIKLNSEIKSGQIEIRPNYFCKNKIDYTNIQIEVGFGTGRHLLSLAKNNPDILFIGIEIYKPSIEKIIKQCELQNIDNIRVVNYDARLFFETIESLSIDKIFLHFPIPWNDAKHRRVLIDKFIVEVDRILKVGGSFELRTDDKIYFEDSKLLIGDSIEYINRNIDITSKYEDRWRREEKDIYDLIYTKKEIKDNEKRDKIDFSFDRSTPKELYYLESDIIVKSTKIYKINSDIYLMGVVMGSVYSAEYKYILFDRGDVRYYQSYPICSNSNYIAHTILRGLINECN